jgi:predicted DNA-binding transcriptional regulator YafY
MKLYNTVKSLILEIASIDSITNSIKNREKVIIYYDGDEPGGRGLRGIEPVCFGYSKADNPVLRAWDEEGASHTAYKGEQPLPGWRLFRVDKILSFKPTGEQFNTPRPNYNPNGDKSMSRVVINAKFGDVPQQQQTQRTRDQIIDDTIDILLDEFRQKFGNDFDLVNAAEAYRRIYSAIQTETGQTLTDMDKQRLRGEIRNKIEQKTR